jgi:hypothetical protein
MNMDFHILINVIFPPQIRRALRRIWGGELVVLMDMDIHILSDVTFPPQIRRALRRIWGG